MFKIKTKDVKRAMKKTGLKICSKQFFKNESRFDGNNYQLALEAACPIGQLYAENHNDDNLEDIADDDKAYNWGGRKFGKAYEAGFIYGFDGQEEYDQSYLKKLNKKYHQEYRDGFKNGKALRKTLLLTE